MPFTQVLPEWNAIGIEPPQSLKDSGWLAGMKPPDAYFNWYMYNTYRALLELQAKAALKDEITISDASTTQKGIVQLSNSTTSTSETMAATPKAVKDVADALTTHSAEDAADDVHGLLSGGKIIEESGSNANGSYVKFADGTLICKFNAYLNCTGGVYSPYNIFFPSVFSDATYSCVAQTQQGGYRILPILSGRNLNSVDVQFYNFDATVFANFWFIAIGRWK